VDKKYILTFVIESCCPFQSRPHPNLCNRSSISITAGSAVYTEFIESHKGQSGTVPEFQEYPGNNTHIAAISFSETWRNYKGPNQACKKGGGTQPCY